jgi:hypothetical protein
LNRQHLESIRSKTCYPTFRGFIQIFVLLGYLVAAAVAGVGIVTGQPGTIAIAVGAAIVIALLFRVAQEMSLMFADIADVTIDSSARSAAPIASSPVSASQPEIHPATPADEAAAMALHGITFDGEKYQFRDFRYDKLSDAISFAKRQAVSS